MQAPHRQRVPVVTATHNRLPRLGVGGGRGRCRGSERTAPGSASARGIRTPRFSGPGFPATVLRGKGAFPGARQHPPWCSRPPKVPVVRVLSSYKLGVRLGRVSLQLTRLGGDCPLPPISSLPQTSLGHMGRGPLLPPAGRSGAGALHALGLCTTQPPTLQPSETRLPPPLSSGPHRACSRGRGDPARCAPPARRGTKAAWHSRARLRPRPGPGHGALSPPALPSSRPRPRPGGAPGGTQSPGTERATRWRPPIAPSLRRDVSSLGGYL